MEATHDDLIELGAAVSLGSLAAQFATEPSRYPEFVAWCNTLTTTEDASWLLAVPPDQLQEISNYLRAVLVLLGQVSGARITINVADSPV